MGESNDVAQDVVYPLRDILFHGVLFKAPANSSEWLRGEGKPSTNFEFGECIGGIDHRGGGRVKFHVNCTQLWDQVPFV